MFRSTKQAFKQNSGLQRRIGRTQYKRVNTARDSAFIQHAAYGGKTVEGYEIDKSLSNEKGTVYVNKKTGKVTIGYAGTQAVAPKFDLKHWKSLGIKNKHDFLQGFKDINADVYIAFGSESRSTEFRKAENQYNAVAKKYGAENVDVTGHSLGGTKAAYISGKYGAHAETYNQGASIMGTEKWDQRNVTAYVKAGDVVPFGVWGQRTSGTGVTIESDRGAALKQILKKEATNLIKNPIKKQVVDSAAKSQMKNWSAESRARGKAGLKTAGRVGGLLEVAKLEYKLHKSSQFVPTGKPDAASTEKPPDSKPIPTFISSQPKPAPIPTPQPNPIPTPTPQPKPIPAFMPHHSAVHTGNF